MISLRVRDRIPSTMSQQDPIDTPQLHVDDPGTIANADPNDLDDRRPSDNTTRSLLPPSEAIDLVRQGMTAPPNLNPCCYRQEVDCNCNVQIQPPVVPPLVDLGYGRISPEKRRTIEEFTKDHEAAREAATLRDSSSTAIPLASPKPRSPTGHKDPVSDIGITIVLFMIFHPFNQSDKITFQR